MKKINELLPIAMTGLRQSGLVLSGGRSILKEYDGYVASFAPSVITAGLKATLSFYTDRHKIKNGEPETPDFVAHPRLSPRRVHVLNLLYTIYQSVPGRLPGGDLLEMALATTPAQERQLKKDLMNCAIALKLAMRNFEQVPTAPDNQNEAAI